MDISNATMQKFVNAHINDSAGGYSNVRYRNKYWTMYADKYGQIDIEYGMIGLNTHKLHFYLQNTDVSGEAEQISILADGVFEELDTEFGSYYDVTSAKVLDVDYEKETA